ncbi:MAG: glycerol-3-phosphate 1-O-acyltransferase PlsY [Clostridia bacterium]|nr:glycerol-3-phosphate 1-O-acyltransferase PlsY [Clostridia bacterium]
MKLYYEILYSGIFGKFLYGNEAIAASAPAYYGLYLGALVLIAVGAYFLGCLNFGIILSKNKFHEDIRTKGSGNAGATNMLRTYGLKVAAVTFIGDAMKAVVSVAVGMLVLGGIGGYTAALACMIGHAYPCIYGFKGGKGVAVTAGSILMLDWRLFLILVVMFALIVWWTRFISLGSVTVFFAFPLLLSALNGGRVPSLCIMLALLMSALGIYFHRSNIKRIYNGTENKVSFKSKKKDSEDE